MMPDTDPAGSPGAANYPKTRFKVETKYMSYGTFRTRFNWSEGLGSRSQVIFPAQSGAGVRILGQPRDIAKRMEKPHGHGG
jgi:hypothetical protein